MRLSFALMGEGLKINIFLMDDGVTIANRHQEQVKGMEQLDMAAKIKELISFGVKVNACTTCLAAKGVRKEDLVDGVQVATMVDLSKCIKESAHVLNF